MQKKEIRYNLKIIVTDFYKYYSGWILQALVLEPLSSQH